MNSDKWCPDCGHVMSPTDDGYCNHCGWEDGPALIGVLITLAAALVIGLVLRWVLR